MLNTHIQTSRAIGAIVNLDTLHQSNRGRARFRVFDADGVLVDEGDLLDCLSVRCDDGDVIFDSRTDRVLLAQR